MFKSQFLPSKEDTENREARELSKRLMGASYEKTLTNIVEWQERNLKYWDERADMFIFLFILSFLPLFFLLPLNVLPMPLIAVLVSAFLLLSFLNFMLLLMCASLLITEVVALLSLIYVPNVLTILVIITFIIPFGGIVSLLLYAISKYRHIKAYQREFRIWDAFRHSLPIGKILKYRLAICRDYAKSTAVLLLNSYPENRIYFITIPMHVATAIKIRDKLYVLDQKLPVLTLEKWMELWNKKMSKSIMFRLFSHIFRVFKGGEVQILEMVLDGRIETKNVSSKRLDKKDAPKIDVDNLTDRVAQNMGMDQFSEKNKSILEIPLKNFAICYEKDEIVEYSLLRAIENKLEYELCGNRENITKIEITQNKTDLILKAYLK